MSKPIVVVLALCLAVVACEERIFGAASWIPESPSAPYRVWWEVVEGCSGRKANIDAVSWFRVPASTGLSVRGESAAGAWFADGNRIAIVESWHTVAPLVRHEMLHAILQTGEHPAEYFKGRCADEVICGRDCMVGKALADAIPVDVEVLDVGVIMYPLSPSLSQHDGRATVVVNVHNPSNASVYVSASTIAQFNCPIGYQVASVEDPAWSKVECTYMRFDETDGRVYFRPGERRRLIFDTQLARISTGGPFHDGMVSVSAIFANSYRETQLVLIRP